MAGRFNPDEYATVAERIGLFYERFPEGRLIATIVEHDIEKGFILMRAEAYRSPDDAVPASTGHASEVQGGNGPQATNYIEVAETSAIGRALANLNFQAKKTPTGRRQAATAPKQIQTAPDGPQDVRPIEPIDREILEALSATKYTERDLNVTAKRDFNKDNWRELDGDEKREILNFLNNAANQRANT